MSQRGSGRRAGALLFPLPHPRFRCPRRTRCPSAQRRRSTRSFPALCPSSPRCALCLPLPPSPRWVPNPTPGSRCPRGTLPSSEDPPAHWGSLHPHRRSRYPTAGLTTPRGSPPPLRSHAAPRGPPTRRHSHTRGGGPPWRVRLSPWQPHHGAASGTRSAPAAQHGAHSPKSPRSVLRRTRRLNAVHIPTHSPTPAQPCVSIVPEPPHPALPPVPPHPARPVGAVRSALHLSLSLHPSLSLGHRLLWSERPALSGLGWRCLPAPTWPGAMAAPQRSGSAALLPSANGAGGHRRENRASWERTGAVPGAAGRGKAAAGAAPVPVPAVPVPAVPWARWMTASGEDVRRGGGE